MQAVVQLEGWWLPRASDRLAAGLALCDPGPVAAVLLLRNRPILVTQGLVQLSP